VFAFAFDNSEFHVPVERSSIYWLQFIVISSTTKRPPSFSETAAKRCDHLLVSV
jgi:hypothetical protein